MGCTPLARVEIYTIEHSEPRRYFEIYVDEHLRCIAVDLGSSTLLSIDVYPESVKTSSSSLGNARCISMESEDVKLCSIDLEAPSNLLGSRVSVRKVSALFLCYKGTCSEIQLRVWIEKDLDTVLAEVCAEDVAELGYRGLEP